MFNTRKPLVAMIAALGLTAGCSSNGSGEADPTFVTTLGAGIGAIGGGAVGSLFGGGTGKTVATGAGAVIGGATGGLAARTYVNSRGQTVSAPVQQQQYQTYQTPVQPQYQQPGYQTSVPTVQPQYQTTYQPVQQSYQPVPAQPTYSTGYDVNASVASAPGTELVYIDPVPATSTVTVPSIQAQPVSTGLSQGYSVPSLATPSYSAPTLTAPSYSTPSYSVPTLQNPVTSATSQVNQYSTAIRSAAEAPVLQAGTALSAPVPSYTLQSAPGLPIPSVPSIQY